ncbi:MAG TPA: hypothetical protein VHZ24_02220 [Pirellulales bacterium]|nr:hypothetical protein [Pirellulales bacterium]
MMRRAVCWIVLGVVALGGAARADDAAAPYALVDGELKLVPIDTSPDESFLSMRTDTLGRLFVGGREALFVYEPKPGGGYAARHELYRFPKDTWVYDLAIRGNDVYVITVPALYVLPGAVTKRSGIVPRKLIWGVPMAHVHQCFHGLAWGPEGDLYFSMGDPVVSYGDFNRPDHWMHWSFFSVPRDGAPPAAEQTIDVNGRRWVRTPYNGVGGVFKCKPDGTGFEVITRGTRNSCGLVFDHDWNLFTNDNDHESIPAQYVPGRLLHIVPHAYYSWPRGWLLSKTPERADLIDSLNDKLGRYVPVGQDYYDETFLPEKYRHNLLVARWCIKSVTRYPLRPNGASFKADEFHLLDGRDLARPVGVCVGRGGRIFVTVCYMAQNEGSPVYKSDVVMITRKDDPPEAPFDAYEATAVGPDKLWDELDNPSWHRRYAAHVELLRRGGDFLEEGRRRHGDAATVAHQHLTNYEAEVFGITTKTSADDPVSTADYLVDHFDDPIDPDAAPPKLEIAAATSRDTVVRQLATLRLAAQGSLDLLRSMLASEEPRERLGGVLAAGFRLTIPPATAEITGDRKLDKLQNEAAFTIQFADETVDLRKLGPIGHYTIADHWKQAKHTDEQEALFALLMGAASDADEQVRLQAVHFLSLLSDTRSEPTVERVIAANEERRLGFAKLSGISKAWLAGPFADEGDGFGRIHEPETGAVDLAAKYVEAGRSIEWTETKVKRQFDFHTLYGNVDRSSCYAYFRLESGTRQRAHLMLGSDDGIEAWHNGRLVWKIDVTRGALPLQDTVVLELQPGSNDILLRVRNVVGTSQLYINYRTLSAVAVVLPEKISGPSLAERLAGAASGQYTIPPEFFAIDWKQAAAAGNATEGRRLFESVGCAKCHALSADEQSGGGPSLAEARLRFTVPYLVESILVPNKQISPLFRATQVVTSDGKTVLGLLVAETAEKIELLLPDTKRVSIAKSDIEERALQSLSPMPQGIVRKPEELRDILAYLLRGK